MTAEGSRGWWRRNWWGLAAVLPVLVVAVALSPNEAYQSWHSAQPREPVGPDRDGWVHFAGTRLRLVALQPADLRESFTGEPYPVPPGLRVWQAVVTFGQLTDPDHQLLLCDFLLEDAAGRRYSDDPSELDSVELPDGSSYYPSLCRPDEEEAAAGSFDAVALFLLPVSAEPAALLLTATDQLPSYVRIPVDPGPLPSG